MKLTTRYIGDLEWMRSNRVCGCDGIGRHAGFRFLCCEACGFESLHPHQKKFTVDFLNKTQKVNEGEAPQYLVRNSHPAIIEPELFDLVQFEMKRRKQSDGRTSGAHPFSGKIYCGECGGMYGSKVWHSSDEYRRSVWQCNDKHKGGETCRGTHLTDGQIQAAFLAAFNARLDSRAEIFEAYDEVLRVLTDNAGLDAEAAALAEECEVVMELTRKAVQEKSAML